MARPDIQARVIAVLREEGPTTRYGIQVALKMDHDQLGSTLKRLIAPTKRYPQRLQIVDWAYYIDGRDRYYPRAVFDIGSGENKPKPKPLTAAENSRRHRTRKLARTLNSVWALAIPKKERLRA